MQVPGLTRLAVGPRRVAKTRLPVVGRIDLVLARVPHVVVTVRIGLVAALAALLEPLVLIGRVIGHKIENEVHLALVHLLDKQIKVLAVAVDRIDVNKRGDIVAAVLAARRIERREPERARAQTLHVVELLRHALQIAHAVAVRVKERLDVDLVDDVGLPPLESGRSIGQVEYAAVEVLHAVEAEPEQTEDY